MPDPWDIVPAPDAYDNATHIPEGPTYPARWAAAAEAFRDRIGDNARLGLIYGPHPREAFDLFLTGSTPKGMMVFLHGGFWRLFGRETWSHLAQGAIKAGWAVAIPSYPVCPEVRIGDITASVARALTTAADYVPGPMVLTGHSAGGHLALRMVSGALPPEVQARVEGVVSISPLADFAPLRHLPLNADWKITDAEVQAESPRRAPAPDIPVEIVVGADERQAFLDQARWQAAAWPKARLNEAPHRHHFDIIDSMVDLSADWLRRPLGL